MGKPVESQRSGRRNQATGHQSTASGSTKFGSSTANSVEIQVTFPACLTSKQRALLHELAEKHSLQHTSTGSSEVRTLVLLGPGNASDQDSKEVVLPEADSLSDSELCQIMQQHFSINASASFSQQAAGTGRAKPRMSSQDAKQLPSNQGQSVSLEAFVQMTGPLLEMEHAAEVGQATEAIAGLAGLQRAQTAGRVLPNLRCSDMDAGLLGRTLISLISNKGGGSIASQPLPPHIFTPHDVVELRPNKGESSGLALASGVVYRVRDDVIVLAVDESPEADLDQPLRLHKLANEVTYNRLKATLEALSQSAAQSDLPGRPLIDALFGSREPRFAVAARPWKPTNARLDDSQRRAVSHALAAQDVALIHGPPGTGKTTTVVELIVQEVARGNKVLATAASNVAVDNLVERLGACLPRGAVVRPGHPARLLPGVLAHSLEAAVMRSDNSSLAKDCRADIKAANARLMKLQRKDYAERRALRSEIKNLAKEERKRQQRAVQEVLSHASVVCATLTGVLSRDLTPLNFDLVVVDEAAQALEVATWGALLKAPRAVLAGDHLQLPPTIISDKAASLGLQRTLFERVHGLCGESVATMLTVQYRMHAAIMTWASEEMYEGALEAHPSVAEHTLQDLQGVHADKGVDSEYGPLLLLDTAGCDMEEASDEGSDSKRNEGEAKTAMAHAQRLVQMGVAAHDIGIITPYSAQVALLRELRPAELANVDVATVDGFQGREKNAIIIAAVRSNPRGEVGFLADDRRMNVAVTRARMHVGLVCDSETLGRHEFLGRLVAYFERHAAYLSAAELVPD